jgi:plastocyanin
MTRKPLGLLARSRNEMGLVRRLPILAAAAFLLVGAAACGGYGGDDKESEEGTTTTIGGAQVESHGTKDVSGVGSEKVEIEMYDNYFEPTILEGKPGQKVTIELKNEGEAAHTFTVSEQSIDQEVQPGDEAESDITFPESGELTFTCKFHESSGMVGELVASS